MPQAKPTDVLAVIPARHASMRFPGKPLAPIAGKSMIQRVVERVRRAERLTRTVVATDEPSIRDAVQAFGGEAILTRKDHATVIDPGTIDSLVEAIADDDSVRVATPCTAISHANDIMDPNVVKVVRDFDGNALYFSRAPVPWVRDRKESVAARHWKHLGLYGFRRDALLEFPTLPPGELEHLEQLEQLRWLENGFQIRVIETEYDAVSVDVPADVERVEKLMRERGES